VLAIEVLLVIYESLGFFSFGIERTKPTIAP